MDFNYLLNYLKYSSFIQSGTFLFSLIPIFITLFLKRTALHNCTCKSNCYDYINFAAVSLSVCCALEFLNICLQDVHLFTALNVWMAFNHNVNMFLLSTPPQKIMRAHAHTHTHISLIQYSSFKKWTWNLPGNIGCSIDIGPRGWLRHCATSRKVAISIPDVITGIFQWHNPGRNMALGLTQPLKGIYSWLEKAAGS